MTIHIKYFQNNGRFEPLELVAEEDMDADYENDYLLHKAETIADADSILLARTFRKYNRDDRPDGHIRRSMSVGDVVSVDGRAYFCDRWGWTRLY